MPSHPDRVRRQYQPLVEIRWPDEAMRPPDGLIDSESMRQGVREFAARIDDEIAERVYREACSILKQT